MGLRLWLFFDALVICNNDDVYIRSLNPKQAAEQANDVYYPGTETCKVLKSHSVRT